MKKKKYTNNFDKIAPVYDLLSRLVYFNEQRNAQTYPLKYVSANAKILIVGGGTGYILEAIAKKYSEGLQIDYVEISSKMLQRSKARNYKNNQVNFIEKNIEDYESETKYDVVITAFLFDNFTKNQAENIFRKINNQLKENGLWFNSGFYLSKGKKRLWKIILTKTMYRFFKTFGIVEGDHLIDMQPHFDAHNYTKKEETFYYRNFIQSTVYKKGK